MCVRVRVATAASANPIPQSDWLTVELADAQGAEIRTIGFTSPRRATARVTAERAPGATAWQRWSLADWAKRSAAPLAPGLVYATATYDSSHETDVFHGALTAHFAVTVR